MQKYQSLNILDALDKWGEMSCQKLLDTYSCPLNPDVERFVKQQAINFARQMVTITHLIIYNDDGGQCLLGYFALSNKFVQIDKNNLSKTVEKKLAKFARFNEELQCYELAIPLIAQLGKNFADNLPMNISGQELLNLAFDRVAEAERILGGKTVYLECSSNPKLYDFYSRSGFKAFGERQSSSNRSEILVQMFKYF